MDLIVAMYIIAGVCVYLRFVKEILQINKLLVLQMPAYTIAQNAGVEGAVVVGKLLEQTNLSIGYDAAKGPSPFLLCWGLLSHSFEANCVCSWNGGNPLNGSHSVDIAHLLCLAAEYVDMVKAGIIDPVKVIRTALVDAARYSCLPPLRINFCIHPICHVKKVGLRIVSLLSFKWRVPLSASDLLWRTLIFYLLSICFFV